MTDFYITQLERIKDSIGDHSKNVEIRGENEASFIYATSIKGRAIELSKTENGVWIEFWNESKELPEFDKSYPNYEEAVIGIREWFK